MISPVIGVKFLLCLSGFKQLDFPRINILAMAKSLTEPELKQYNTNGLLDTKSWSPYADRVWGKNFQIWPFDHYSLFRGRKPSKTWLQRESLTLEINDTICYNKVSDHYTANSTESLYSRYSQRYSHFQRENVPSSVFSIFSEKLQAVRVLLIF